MASGGEKRKRRQRQQSREQGGILEQGEHDSSLAPDVIESSPDYRPCVTLEAPSDGHLAEGGSAESQRKSAAGRDKREIRVTEPATCQSSSLACISGDQSREGVQSHRLVTSTVTAGQVGRHYARTAAEISPTPDVFGQDEDGDTFLHIAVAQGDQPLTAFFIQRMKSRGIDIYNKLRQTPLHLAVITRQAYMVKKLIEGGADVNLMDRHGQTALHLACQAGDVNSVYAIRDVTSISRVKIRFELKNSHGFSALHVATFNGSKQLIATILDMGADIDDKDSNSGRTALHHAVEAGKHQVVEYLISRGADVNKVTFAGNTPLHTASGREMDDMAKLLLRHGANANIANLEGDIPKVVRTSEQAKRQFLSKPTDSKRRKR